MKAEFKVYATPECDLMDVRESVVLCASFELDPIDDNTDVIGWDA